MMLLFYGFQILCDISRNGGSARHAVDRAVTVGVDKEAVGLLVASRLDWDGELTEFFAGVWYSHQMVIKHQVLVVILSHWNTTCKLMQLFILYEKYM